MRRPFFFEPGATLNSPPWQIIILARGQMARTKNAHSFSGHFWQLFYLLP
jgi:hypothetical protein